MSSQHRNLAAVWDYLAERTDIAETLREITGHHALQSALHEDDYGRVDGSVQTMIWIKTIFDLQRCYLGGTSKGVSECSPNLICYLLPSELLFSSILYLIDIKAKSFPRPTTMPTGEYTLPTLILAQTILSGLRLLLLRKDDLSLCQRRRLQSAINSAWADDHVHGSERFMSQQMFVAILDSLNDRNHIDSHQTKRAKARLPMYATGLDPMDIRPETFVNPLVQALPEEDEDWLDAYWVLFDAIWAVECAVTQRFVVLRRQLGATGIDRPENDEILQQLDQQRASLIISIFHVAGPMMPYTTLLESLAITLLDWNEDLDRFLLRRDSLLQHHPSMKLSPTRQVSYGGHIAELRPYINKATLSFSEWLSKRRIRDGPINIAKTNVAASSMHDAVKEWVERMASPIAMTLFQGMDEPYIPVYVVNCPKLHALPKKWLTDQLRWCDKWAYRSIGDGSSIVNWKDGVQCPSCTSWGKITCARLIEPLQPASTTPRTLYEEDHNSSQCSVEGSVSYRATSSTTSSHPIFDDGTSGNVLPSQTTMTVSIASCVSHPGSDVERSHSAEAQFAQHTETPISPLAQLPYGSSMPECPMSPLDQSLNILIPTATGSRSSVDLPIPVCIPPTRNSIYEKILVSRPSDLGKTKLDSLPSTPTENEADLEGSWSSSLNSRPQNQILERPRNTIGIRKSKSKLSSRGLRIANSIRRKPPGKTKNACTLPKELAFAFSTSGHTLLLWGKNGEFVIRFDISPNDASAIQSCRYKAGGIEAAAAGHRRCAIIVSNAASKKKLLVFSGLETTPAFDIELQFFGRIADVSVAMSRDDKYVAVSINGQIELFNLDSGLKRIAFQHETNIYELRGGVSRQHSNPMAKKTSPDAVSDEMKSESGSWFTEQSKSLSSKEAAEKQKIQTAIITRKLYFSTDNQRLVVATQLGDHCIYVDVWDVTREPVSTISEHSRSFKLPPWTLNDGDLTGIFYDSARRAALFTAFLGKEYPVLIPFPGYEPLQNEMYSTKIISATQSPSGSTFIVANGMTEIIHFRHTAKGTLAPHKLKKSSSKISAGVFKPGSLALAMPQEDCLRAFWIKDGKCMLRTIKLGTTETIQDVDLRSQYDRLMSLKGRPVIARAPSLCIPELDAGGFI